VPQAAGKPRVPGRCPKDELHDEQVLRRGSHDAGGGEFPVSMRDCPLPASTQREILEEAAEVVQAALDELIQQAAQGEVLHNDDTSMRVRICAMCSNTA
jgi:hypothetical protein